MNEQSADPNDAESRLTFAELSDQQLHTVLETAANCFAIWRSTSVAERAAVVERAAAIMRLRGDW
ncbi:MAG: aldehyde dehydrogenase family protein [Sulfuritalea sp.]|nr:aldehyde dehydrogenase family protein [Sulfuritalea sp.]